MHVYDIKLHINWEYMDYYLNIDKKKKILRWKMLIGIPSTGRKYKMTIWKLKVQQFEKYFVQFWFTKN